MKQKLTKNQQADLARIRGEIVEIDKKIDSLLDEAYNLLGLDKNQQLDEQKCDWVFDALVNGCDMETCMDQAGFEL